MRRGGLAALLGIALAVSSEAGTLVDLARELPRIKPLEPAAAISDGLREGTGCCRGGIAGRWTKPAVASPVCDGLSAWSAVTLYANFWSAVTLYANF